MKRVTNDKKKFCGNCSYHNTYDYPLKVFCFVKFRNHNNPVVSVFDCCDQWEYNPQGCFCLEEASKKSKKKAQR